MKSYFRLVIMVNLGRDLEQIDIPRVFLKLPSFEQIIHQPKQNYNYPLKGQIHSEKYKALLNSLSSQEPAKWRGDVRSILQGNAVLEKIENLTFHQYLDFIIHIAYANEEIGWNSISILEKYLLTEFNHVPRWELPSLDFEIAFQSFSNTRYTPSFTSEMVSKITTIQSMLADKPLYDGIISSGRLTKNVVESYNLSEYFELVGNLVTVQKMGLVKYDGFSGLITDLFKIFREFVTRSPYLESTQRILSIIFGIYIFASDDIEHLKFCQSLLDTARSEVDHLDNITIQKNYTWLIDACRAIIVNNVTKYKMEMVTEDLLIRSISNRFLHPEGTYLDTWKETIQNSSLPLPLLLIIVRGYYNVGRLLHRYNTQLPEAHSTNIREIINFIIDIVEHQNGTGTIRPSVIDEFPIYLQYYHEKILIKTSIQQLVLSENPSEADCINTIRECGGGIFSEYFRIFKISSEMIVGSYQFDRYMARIQVTENNYVTLVGNEEFADIFVNNFAQAFNFAQQRQVNGATAPIDIYHHLTHIVLTWLAKLVQLEDLVQEGIILFLSFLKVIVNMIVGYYTEKGRLKTAKLWDLNYKLFELNLNSLFDYPKLANINKILSPEHLFDDFLRVMKQFELNEEVVTVDTRYLAIDTDYDLSALEFETDESVKPQKLHEHNILEYLDIRNNLDEFLKGLESSTADELKDWFANRPFPNREKPMTILDHFNLDQHYTNLHFPFLQPLDTLSASIEFFDLDIELPSLNKVITTSTKAPVAHMEEVPNNKKIPSPD